jgi:hypothetical protein
MLLMQSKKKIIWGISLTCLLALLSSCSKSAAIESLVSADPNLKKGELLSESVKSNPETFQAETANSILLPANFPQSIPLYPEAQLQQTKPGTTRKTGEATWKTADNTKTIADYYQKELIANNWQIIQPFILNTEQNIQKTIASKDNLKISIAIARASARIAEPSLVDQDNSSNTQLTIAYQPLAKDTRSTPTIATKVKPESETTNQKDANASNLKATTPPTLNLAVDSGFSDLDEVPEQLRESVEKVATLGILTPYTKHGNVELNKFAPNEIITRGEYARWLIGGNNLYYDSTPGKKIYVASKTNQPAFQDIQVNSPDFGAIQGLAEAGLVPSRLTDDSSKLLFQPDAPLKREDFITWKVPLDMRKALPTASIEAIKESWGFQDAADINSSAIRALYADFQNGDRSNIRRIFGYTTLFQPKKPMTRAEAAASLWYFGFQGDGITAPEVLKSKEE